jgi:hypothetical protein
MKRITQFTKTLLVLGALALAGPAAAQADRSTYRIDVPLDWYLTPTEFPCLTETIHVTGTYQEFAQFVVSPNGQAHFTLHQTTNNLIAIGLTTGDTYQFSGPLTQSVSGSVNQPYVVEFTFHNINHFVGPGPDANIYLRTLTHVTFNPTTGVPKVEIAKDEVLCH